VLHGINTDWALELCVLRKFVLGYERYHPRKGMANVVQLLINTESGVSSYILYIEKNVSRVCVVSGNCNCTIR